MKGKGKGKKGETFTHNCNLKIGLVGKATTGKTLIFNSLTNSDMAISDFAMEKEPNIGICKVPDERLDFFANKWPKAKKTHATILVTDVSGFVTKPVEVGGDDDEEASGLGRQYLNAISTVDGIYHVVRVFKNKKAPHPDGSIDPIRDIKAVHVELRNSDKRWFKGQLKAMEKQAKGNRERAFDVAVAKKCLDILNDDRDVRFEKWSQKEQAVLKRFPLLTKIPQIYLINMSAKDYRKGKNKHLKTIEEYIAKNSGGKEKMLLMSALFEKKIQKLGEEERKKFCEENKCFSTIGKVIQEGFSVMNLIYFFTVGDDENRCWTIRKGSNAQKAAGSIHTTLEKSFVCAEVYQFADYLKHGSERELKERGLIRREGKKYIMKDGDCVFFRAGSMKKKKD